MGDFLVLRPTMAVTIALESLRLFSNTETRSSINVGGLVEAQIVARADFLLGRSRTTLLIVMLHLECEAEGLRSGRRSLTIAGIHIGQRRIEGAMPQVLPDEKSVRAGAYHEHCSRVFEHVRML